MIDVKSKENYPLENPSYLFAVIIIVGDFFCCCTLYLCMHIHAYPTAPWLTQIRDCHNVT